MRKGTDGTVGVVDTLYDTRFRELVNEYFFGQSVCSLKDQFGTSGLGYADFYILVNITIGMTGNGNRGLPVAYGGTDGG